MWNLFILNESFTNGLNYNFLNVVSMSSILCGVLVIVSKNPIVSVLFLIGLFFSIAGYLMMLGLNFIGLSYLLVYVGAVSILFLFILMLINVRISELVTDSSNSIPLAVMIGVIFNITLYKLLPSNLTVGNAAYMYNSRLVLGDLNKGLFDSSNASQPFGSEPNTMSSAYLLGETSSINYPLNNIHNKDLSFVTSKMWDGLLSETSHITSIGNVIYTNYPLWLILTSIVLLLAMVGAIVITIKK